ncbi:MAG: MBL fold metallo-hydrolase [Balneolaceae bacterium]|nr:MAG: MBL fold metallo-hydrolase [Balneolaceae bacterium]
MTSSNSQTLQFGPFQLNSVEAGRFLLDGGAMFGVVPKTMWNRKIPADQDNRIKMAMRSLLIRSEQTGKTYLIDTGSGHKFSDKLSEIYGFDYQHSELIHSLSKLSVSPSDITDIIFSHLHFDHCGGTTQYVNGELLEVFKNATYHVNRHHWETATNPNQREKASFFRENLQPVADSGRLNLTDETIEFESGFTVLTVHGHTLGQQLPVIKADDNTIVFVADLIPTHAHVPLPWIMGYDMNPVQTLQEKESFLEKAAEENWYLFLEHDADHEVITVKKSENRYLLNESLLLHEIEKQKTSR